MAGYTEHDKIAKMAGIPLVISDEINRFMDDMNPPKEFEDHNTEKRIFVCGHLNVSIRTLMGSEKLHDRGKREWVQKEDLKWLLGENPCCCCSGNRTLSERCIGIFDK